MHTTIVATVCPIALGAGRASFYFVLEELDALLQEKLSKLDEVNSVESQEDAELE